MYFQWLGLCETPSGSPHWLLLLWVFAGPSSSTQPLRVGGPQHSAFSVHSQFLEESSISVTLWGQSEVSIPIFPQNPNFSLTVHLITTGMAYHHHKLNIPKPKRGSLRVTPLLQPSIGVPSHVESGPSPYLHFTPRCLSDLISLYFPPARSA